MSEKSQRGHGAGQAMNPTTQRDKTLIASLLNHRAEVIHRKARFHRNHVTSRHVTVFEPIASETYQAVTSPICHLSRLGCLYHQAGLCFLSTIPRRLCFRNNLRLHTPLLNTYLLVIRSVVELKQMTFNRHTSRYCNILNHFLPHSCRIGCERMDAKQCGPSCSPCQSFCRWVMSQPRNTAHRRHTTWPDNKHDVHGRQHGDFIMLMVYPEHSLVFGSAGKQIKNNGLFNGRGQGRPWDRSLQKGGAWPSRILASTMTHDGHESSTHPQRKLGTPRRDLFARQISTFVPKLKAV